MIFKDNPHREFYEDCVYRSNAANDPYRKALFYTLGLTDETRRYINHLYDFKERGIVFDGLFEGWQTSASINVTRMAFNLYNGFIGDVGDGRNDSPDSYSPYNLYDTGLMAYFLEAVKLRYPEHYQEVSAEPTKKAWIYVRLASAGIEPVFSLERQMQPLIKHAADNNIKIVGITQSIGSGLDYEHEVLKAAEAKCFDTLLVRDASRLGRDMLKTHALIQYLDYLGVTIETSDGTPIRSNKIAGKVAVLMDYCRPNHLEMKIGEMS